MSSKMVYSNLETYGCSVFHRDYMDKCIHINYISSVLHFQFLIRFNSSVSSYYWLLPAPLAILFFMINQKSISI